MVIGVTGLVGSGKSTLTRYLQDGQSIVVDADQLVHEQWEHIDHNLSQALIQRLGPQVVSECGTVDRQSVRKYLAFHPSAITTVEQLLHPRVKAVIQGVIQANPDRRIILDVPLLFEAGLDQLCDYTIQVSASATMRLSRLIQRDGEEKALHLMKINQRAWTQAQREAVATFTVVNEGDFDSLYQQIQAIVSQIAR